jgi:hypothetical protein
MRRDYFTLTVDGVGGGSDRRPVVTVGYEGPAGQLETRMTKGEALLDDPEVDVGYRLRGDGDGDGDGDDDDPDGVLAVADRVTGEYLLELNAPSADVFGLVEAAREFGQAADTEERYRIVVERDGEELVTYDKSTLLVYDDDGELLRSRSLIPSGVEL